MTTISWQHGDLAFEHSCIGGQPSHSGPPRAIQGISKVEPRDGHPICILQVHPPTSLCPPFLLKQNLSPKNIAGSDITRSGIRSYIHNLLYDQHGDLAFEHSCVGGQHHHNNPTRFLCP